jgi:3,4-dihydroxy 2-butanone 4-phosphate synthase/GTP cyclohydrolase II
LNGLTVASVGEILDDVRHGRMVVLVDDRNDTGNEGVVMVPAEFCAPQHVTLMARRARGLVCLALTPEHCRQLDLPPMVEGGDDSARFTLSIEAAQGIETGISAADRAHTVRVAVSPRARPGDIVQPGHIFPLTAERGGVLTRAGHTEAAVDYARIAGLTPAAVIADILDDRGELADAQGLAAFAAENGLRIGAITDLVNYRLANERTIAREREGEVDTRYGRFQMTVYRDRSHGDLHIALQRGHIDASVPTLVRVHVAATLRDLLGTEVDGERGWDTQRSLCAIDRAGAGVLVLLSRRETDEQLLASVDLALGRREPAVRSATEPYNTVGLGSQILRDLGVGKIRLMGAPIKYNALSGFGLEVCDYLEPEDGDSGNVYRIAGGQGNQGNQGNQGEDGHE